ncbi:GNAT family N-acetyltransferase [Mucilaginibacter sp. SP1R1]|uniref:GNAT family N-acetyltransferase n=1 Tax=Mucilaginibacter sp. SP1R1 TaxID=2723091 RepID=UPI00161D353B|nr:GNAT family N-acetyltransferase [Mucilaginibacter sp. SP1R1]MBB6151153.1 hypothetical protein [Mucilaginibacter sp. SP1R1]
MTKLLTIHDKLEWIAYVRRAAEFDFYHTWNYHTLETGGTPALFVYEEQDDFIAFPMLKRAIPGSDYSDLTSVYGYSGPFSNKKMDVLDDSLMENFKQAFLSYLSDEKYVSVFSRMHPFYKQQLLLGKFGGVYDNGRTVVIDLAESLDEQRKKYRQSTMDSVKHAWKMGFYIKDDKKPESVAVFRNIYAETMKRVGASDYYLFDEDYFNRILNTQEYDARVLTVYHDDKPACSTIITFTNGIIQAHLLGTATAYLHHSPAKFLADEISIMGRALGMRYYNLGGGVGFKEDALFKWKQGFSELCFDYKSWRYIANPAIYQELLDEKELDKNADIDFFPLYRYA